MEEKILDGFANQLMKSWTDVSTQALKSCFNLIELAIPNPIADVEEIPETTQTNQDAAEVWQNYIQEMQMFNRLWVNALSGAIKPLSQAAVTTSSKPWIELNNLYWNLFYEKTLGSLVQIPLLGPNRGFSDTLLRAFGAWAKLYPTNIDYQLVIAEIQLQSFAELMRELNLSMEKGEKIEDWQQFQQLWSRIADKVFEQAFCSEDNLKVRGKLLNAINHYKLCQQELIEIWMTSINLPTRSEVDEVHKNIYDLRKEIKSLKKNLAKYDVQAQVTSSDPQEPPMQSARWATANRDKIGNDAAVFGDANGF
jgi:polyhydroxyalkanoate synthase subunit PhaE